jgi:hypothetical protein
MIRAQRIKCNWHILIQQTCCWGTTISATQNATQVARRNVHSKSACVYCKCSSVWCMQQNTVFNSYNIWCLQWMHCPLIQSIGTLRFWQFTHNPMCTEFTTNDHDIVVQTEQQLCRKFYSWYLKAAVKLLTIMTSLSNKQKKCSPTLDKLHHHYEVGSLHSEQINGEHTALTSSSVYSKYKAHIITHRNLLLILRNSNFLNLNLI